MLLIVVFLHPPDYMYGPLRFSRSDLVALTVQRGRDFGLPSYNQVREGLGLAPVGRWGDINPQLNITNPQVCSELLTYCL